MNGASKDVSNGHHYAEQAILHDSDEVAEDLGSDIDLGALLKEIQVANGVADGVELKLDNLIDQLDAILQKLEGDASQSAPFQVRPGSVSNSTSFSYNHISAAGS